MTTPLQRAATRIAQQYKRNPEAVQLAKLASLAVRVEPHLLRRLRLSLLPDADVGIEADLWFGPLVESRGVRSIVLNRFAVELLRENLGEEPQLLRRVIALTEHAHAGTAGALRLEERLTALALLNEPDAVQAIDEAMRPALRTMQAGGEDARTLAQWAMRALPQAHPRVRESRNAITLGLSATLALGGRPILEEVPNLQGSFGDMGWLLRGASSAQPARIGVEFVDGGVAFAHPGGDGPQLELPATNPLLLSLAWKTDGGDARMVVEAVPGRIVGLDASVTQVTLSTLTGDEYLLSAVPPVEVAATAPSEYLGARHFESDVYISYAALDDQPIPSKERGWVTMLHASLEAMLSMRLGRKVRIWRDHQLRGSDSFAEIIPGVLARTALLVCVATPRYVQSEWCLREVREFCALAEQSGGVAVDNRSRVVKVLKAPLDTEELLPSVLKNTLGYDFFTLDDDGTPLELDPAHGAEVAQKYNLKLAELAWDIAQMLKKLEATGNAGRKSGAAPGEVRATIYLAECSYDRRDAREALKLELMGRGYRVLPDRDLPGRESDYLEEVRQLIRQCQLSIHLVGSSPGTILDGPSSKSVPELQNDVAVEYSKSAGLPRLIWLPKGTQSRQAAQQQFIDRLLRDEESQLGAELLTGDLEYLKNSVLAALDKLQRSKPPEPQPARLIYLICDERDRPSTIPLRKFCRSHGFTIALPAFEGDAAALRKQHEELLTTCDAVILFYGAGSELWKREVESGLRRMRTSRDRPWLARLTYIAPPITNDKEDLIELEESNLIDGLKGLPETPMKTFLDSIQSGGGTA